MIPKKTSIRRVATTFFILVVLSGISGCQALQEIANLRNVNFALDNVSDMRLAGVELSKLKQYDRLNAIDVAKLARAALTKDLPLEFTLHVGAQNPPQNSVNARLTQLSWSLFLQDKQTVEGVFAQPIVLAAGQQTDIPIQIALNLTDFFEGSAPDLVNLAANLVGAGGEPTNIKLLARPVIDTPIGPIQYPNEIEIVSRTVGN